MWIKRTSVSGKKGTYYYHQLMRSYRDGNSSRQEVLLNLGCLDEMTEKRLKNLARRLDNNPYQFIPQEDAALLPMKRYGATFLLNKAFEITSTRRFAEDYMEFLHLDKHSVDYVFLLLAYYSFQQGEESLESFLESHFVHGVDEVDGERLMEAIAMFCRFRSLYPGLDVTYKTMKEMNDLSIEYLVKAKVAPEFGSKRNNISISVASNLAGFPLNYHWSYSSPRHFLKSGENTIYATMDEENELHRMGVKYLTYISEKRLCAILGLDALDTLRETCVFEPFETYFNGVCVYNGLKVIFRRTASKDDGSWVEDIFLTNVVDLQEKQLFVLMENTSYTDNYFYRIFVPREVEVARGVLTEKKLIDAIVAVSFSRLYMEFQLVQRLEPFGVSLEDVYNIFRDSRILPVGKEKHKILIHTAYTEEQTHILELISFNHSFQNRNGGVEQ